MNTKQIILSAVGASILANAALSAQHSLEFSNLDKNGNEAISLEELDAAVEMRNIFDNIDTNNNGVFDFNESVDTVINYDLSMDIDDGGHVERQEFTVGIFNNLDKNQDKSLDQKEFTVFSDNLMNSRLLGSN